MKKIIKKLLPKPIRVKLGRRREIYRLKHNNKHDLGKFLKYSFRFGVNKDKRHYEADLIFYYHKIEKGLALPSPRVGFGMKNIKYLLKSLEQYVGNYGWDKTASVTLDTLYEYYYFNKKNDLELSSLFNRIEKMKATLPSNAKSGIGGITEIKKEDIDKRNIDFKEFAYSRYSIRNFTPEAVSDKLIKEAVEIAQKTPSVCNRQSAKVYSYKNENKKKEILQYQNGNAGFGDTASHILIVTMDLRDFRGTIERNQSYIDGGMYAMSLIYALHSLGLGTCPLNLCLRHDKEEKLKEASQIADSEVFIMMIAVGHIPENLYVASSPRRKVSKVLTFE